MLKRISKKVFCVVAIVVVLVLAGCGKDSGKVTETGTNAESGENGTISSGGQKLEESTKAPTPTPTLTPTSVPTAVLKERTKTTFRASKPAVADWSALKITPTRLEKANRWGYDYDFRLADLSGLDLSGEYEGMKYIVFDTFTVWPDKLPKGFDPEAIMETGRNPGLGIRSLQEKGITGKGVNIAIIDQPLLLQHQEYASRIKLYEQGNCNMMASMHGPCMTSLLVGKDIGVAPDAGVYYIGTFNFNTGLNGMELDYTHYADAIDRLLEINLGLPKEEKIRAISMSACWSPGNKGYDEVTAAIERAKKEGIFVVSCNMFENYDFWMYSLDKEPGTDPDKDESYMIMEWEPWIKEVSHIEGFPEYFEKEFTKNFDGEFLLVPINSRTWAEATGEDVYCFSRSGGWSSMEPYMTGLYAMACQVKPDITPELFWKTALETGILREVTREGNKYPARMLNPVALIEKLQK